MKSRSRGRGSRCGPEGDRVVAGDVLARLDPVQQQQAPGAARTGRQTARAERSQGQADFARLDALLERRAAIRTDRDAAEDSFQAASGALARAQAGMEQADKALRDTTPSAPQNATVIDRLAEEGQVVGAAQPVFDRALATGVGAIFDVPEVLLADVHGPVAVLLCTLDNPDAASSGTVSEVSPLVSPDTGTMTVKMAIDAPPDRLDPAEAVRGTISFADALVGLPWTALSAQAGQPAVWRVFDSGAVDLVQVTVDSFATERMFVSDRIRPGDRIVGRGRICCFPVETPLM
ncbi:efflux RND transporter periplasmic adaptor subunit [Salipiger aestuarii]|uniref:efflux RND transporter periplasmic adaptor subunit n=1 Tax=Salipiger aestuarii TaxID=568098 RepID=UPI00123897CC|nr:efflux RND transporter periplasmic adaptor subunit [Salipiger aestuarii]